MHRDDAIKNFLGIHQEELSASVSKLTLLALGFLILTGCVVNEVRPQPKLQAVQATQMIAQAELLDVAVVDFDPGVPKALLDDEQELEKRRIYPEVRRAESRLLAVRLKETLENSPSVVKTLMWDGTNESGSDVSKGIYLYRLNLHYPKDGKTISAVEKLVITH